MVTCWLVGPDCPKSSTTVQVWVSSSAAPAVSSSVATQTSTVTAASPMTTGRRLSAKVWAGVPSERPTVSARTLSAWIMVTVPPIVDARMPETRGDCR